MKTQNDYDVVAHSFNGFPVATSDEFGVFLRAIGASRGATAHPTPVETFLDAHPIAKSFVSTQKPPPASYSTAAYFGVNAFRFTNASGQSVHVRYRLAPAAGEQYLTSEAASTKGANYLEAEIAARLRKSPVRFDTILKHYF